MTLNAIALIILMMLALDVCDARMPQVGDHVYVTTAIIHTEGTITDIANGFLSIKDKGGIDYCFGIGAITSLTWT